MPENLNDGLVKLDLNNPVFQENWLRLERDERDRVTDTLSKIRQLTWNKLYQDKGLKWEKISSIKLEGKIESIYSLRITKSRRATAYRDRSFIRFLTIAADHDATYGKK
jgi:hypothetical protein